MPENQVFGQTVGGENGKARTSGIWNCSGVFWNVRPFTTGTQPASREEIIIVKQIRTLLSCI